MGGGLCSSGDACPAPWEAQGSLCMEAVEMSQTRRGRRGWLFQGPGGIQDAVTSLFHKPASPFCCPLLCGSFYRRVCEPAPQKS